MCGTTARPIRSVDANDLRTTRPLRADERHDVGARHSHRRLVHDREEDLEIEGHGQPRVRPGPRGQELEILVDERMTDGNMQCTTGLDGLRDARFPTHGRSPPGTPLAP